MISNGLTDRLITLEAAAAWELKYYLSLEDTQQQHVCRWVKCGWKTRIQQPRFGYSL